jgi:hypothetical protein
MTSRTYEEDEIDEILLYVEDGLYEVEETDEKFTIRIDDDRFVFDIPKGVPEEPEPVEEEEITDEEEKDYVPFDKSDFIVEDNDDDEEEEEEQEETPRHFEDKLIKRQDNG